MIVTLAYAVAPLDVPVDPSAPEARRWLIEELAKPEYQAARPSWFDLAAKAVWDWLTSLTVPGTAGWDGLIAVVIAILVAGVLVVVFLVYGRPRLNRRAARVALFTEDDERTARELRRAAETAAARSDWSTAIEERFRALAVALDERTLVSVARGTTAQSFAVDASGVFPGHATSLRTAADTFDAVRYLGASGSRERYEELRSLDDALASASARSFDTSSATASATSSATTVPK